MSKKINKYLIASFNKLKHPIGSELIFTEEYLFNLYSEKERSVYKCFYTNSLNYAISSQTKANNVTKKKLKLYRKQFTILFNSYHKTEHSSKYWGYLTDQIFIMLIQTIILNINLLQKVKTKNFFPIIHTVNKLVPQTTNDLIEYLFTNDFKKLLSGLILNELGSKAINIKHKDEKKITFLKRNNYKFGLNFLIKLYIYICKPVVIIDGHIGLKNTFHFFFRSFGKILNIPSRVLFDNPTIDRTLDKDFRETIKVSENDLIDKIFNKIIGNIFPVNLMENFHSIKKKINNLSNKITKIGTGNLHYYNDYFNILTAEILNKNGKLLIFQHGGLISKTNNLLREYKDQQYAFKKYYFDNKKGLGQHFFNTKKFSLDDIKKRNSILILNTGIRFQGGIFSKYSNHPYLEPSQDFFSKLEESTKKKILIKLLEQQNTLELKKIWSQKFGKKINFLPTSQNANKKNFYDAKLVILNEISTPFYELIYSGLPFILIHKTINLVELKSAFRKKVTNLKKINILFNDSTEAANFVNSLSRDNNIEKWWKKTCKTKNFLDLKNYLIVEKKNYLSTIVEDLTKLK